MSENSDQNIQQLQAQLAMMQQQLEYLTLQSTQPPSSTPTNYPSTSTTKSLKVAPPDIFDGTLCKTEEFLSQLSIFLYGKRNELQDDSDKIFLTLSYMKGGTAGPWAKAKVRQYTNGTVQTYTEFLKEFKEIFGDPDPSGTARNKLDHLTQGSHTADEYVASFREVKDDTGYNDAALVEKFEKGLNPPLVDKIYALPEMPETLNEWIHWATKLDRQWRQRETKKKTTNILSAQRLTKSSTLTTKPLRPSHTKQSEEVSMDIDAAKKNIRPIICYKCRQTGHIARNCQSKLDIKSMDYNAIKAYMKEELQKELSQDF